MGYQGEKSEWVQRSRVGTGQVFNIAKLSQLHFAFRLSYFALYLQMLWRSWAQMSRADKVLCTKALPESNQHVCKLLSSLEQQKEIYHNYAELNKLEKEEKHTLKKITT